MLTSYFNKYPASQAPFMHNMYQEWLHKKPLQGLSVLHHAPVVANTLLKIACLVAAGANVTVTNPGFMQAHDDAVQALNNNGIDYVEDLSSLKQKTFDIYLDCGAELYQALSSPKIGAVELTGTGDHYYRSQQLSFPVVSIDKTLTKQVETVFGVAISAAQAIAKLAHTDVLNKTWLIFGFGKIGRGLAYYCVNHDIPFHVVEKNLTTINEAKTLGVSVIHPDDNNVLKSILTNTDIVVTATGIASVLAAYPKSWFNGKILANMGILDEYGNQFESHEVLNNKLPINFIMPDPTPIEYIDPEFYAHNIAAIELLTLSPPNGVTDLSKECDDMIIDEWTTLHNISRTQIDKWFIR